MKVKTVILICLTGTIISPLVLLCKDSRAESKTDNPSSKIGVINIQRVFLDSKINARYEQEAAAGEEVDEEPEESATEKDDEDEAEEEQSSDEDTEAEEEKSESAD